MYSRIGHHENRTLIRQIILALGGSVILVVLFLVAILPAFIKFLAYRNFSSKIAATPESVLPTRPFLSAAFEATSSATLELTGTAQKGQKIMLLQNGAPGPETSAKDDGSYTFSGVTLEAGQNSFSSVAIANSGERSNPSNTITVSFVKDAPKLEISSPEGETTISQRKQNPISVKGKTDPGDKVYINDRLTFVSADGSFSGQVQLTEGDNTIVVRALNAASVETTNEIVVHYTP